jgi:hypothetical protein
VRLYDKRVWAMRGEGKRVSGSESINDLATVCKTRRDEERDDLRDWVDVILCTPRVSEGKSRWW